MDEVGDAPFELASNGADEEKATITALTGVQNHNFPAIREWIKIFLQDESEVNIELQIQFLSAIAKHMVLGFLCFRLCLYFFMGVLS